MTLSAACALALAGCAKGAEDKGDVDAAPDADMGVDAAPEPDARQEAKSFEVTFRPPLIIPDNDPRGIDVAVVALEVEYTTGVDIEVDVTHPYAGDLGVEVFRESTSLKVFKMRDPQDDTVDLKKTYMLGVLELKTPLNATYNVRFTDTGLDDAGVINRVKFTFKVD